MVLVRVAALSTAVLSTGNARDRPGIELWLLGGVLLLVQPSVFAGGRQSAAAVEPRR